MKINKTALFTVFAVMVMAFAFSVMSTTATACSYYDDCYEDYGGEEVNVNVENSNTNSNTSNSTATNNNTVNVNSTSNTAVTGSCSVFPSHAQVGEVVDWQAEGHGGDGWFTYTWTGTDGLSSYYPVVGKIYNTPGTKTGRVEITSNGQTIVRTCTVVIEEEEDEDEDLTGSCSVSSTRADVGEVVDWQAEGHGGDGYYTYTWTGTDGLSSYYPVVGKIYHSPGTKTGTVRIESGDQSITRTCSIVIDDEDEDDHDDLDGYCKGRPANADEDERVTWTAYPEGGDGDYEYDWSGTDGLDGDDKSISKRYDDEGTKRATVRITSDGETITRTCDVDVDEENDDNDNDDLEVSCKASPTRADIGERVRWTVSVDGGDGDYEYNWDGDDNLNGDDKTIYKTYRTDGRKDAEVEVESDGERETARCHVTIDEDDTYVPPKNDDDGIYLSSIPATGISPTMKVSLFVAGMLMWSAFLAYLYIARRNEKIKEEEALAGIEE